MGLLHDLIWGKPVNGGGSEGGGGGESDFSVILPKTQVEMTYSSEATAMTGIINPDLINTDNLSTDEKIGIYINYETFNEYEYYVGKFRRVGNIESFDIYYDPYSDQRVGMINKSASMVTLFAEEPTENQTITIMIYKIV